MSAIEAVSNAENEVQPGDYVTTREAADMLGVSVGTVLNMVERGSLSAWRTHGGHRRIALAAVLEQGIGRQPALKQPPVAAVLSVLVIEDEAFQRELYSDQFSAWQLPIDLRLVANGIQGLTEIGRSPPDVLLIDLNLPGVDGFQVVRELRGLDRYDAMDIIAISGLSDAQVASAGGLPEGVVRWHKPIPFAQLRGFIDARLAAVRRGKGA